MTECRVRNTTQVLVGLERIGVIGLEEAFAVADEAEETEREDLVDRMIEVLARNNYVPAGAINQYRTAVWREYLRRRGEDIREFYSEIDVLVLAAPGAETEGFVSALGRAFAKHELKPSVTAEEPQEDAKTPQLLIDGEVVIEGTADPRRLSTAVSRQISDW